MKRKMLLPTHSTQFCARSRYVLWDEYHQSVSIHSHLIWIHISDDNRCFCCSLLARIFLIHYVLSFLFCSHTHMRRNRCWALIILLLTYHHIIKYIQSVALRFMSLLLDAIAFYGHIWRKINIHFHFILIIMTFYYMISRIMQYSVVWSFCGK